MPKPPDLHVVREPEAPANVVHISGIRSHVGAVTPRPVAPPWPREHAWRDLIRRKPVTRDPVR